MNQFMGDPRETKFVCNFCNKSYPCGKSLGGHIRVHKNQKSSRVAVNHKERTRILKLQAPMGKRRSERDSESEIADGNSGHGPRENSKMKQRVADSRFTSSQHKFCRECGKGFQSSEALRDHLASHSEKEGGNRRLQNHLGITHQKLGIEDDRSDSTESLSSIEKVYNAARCLMMMSRDDRVFGSGDLNSAAESSGQKSPPHHLRESVTSTSNSNGGLEMKETKRRKIEVDECGNQNSDPAKFRKEARKNVKLKVSVNGTIMDGENKKPEAKCGFIIGSTNADSLKNSMENEKNGQVHTPHKYELRKRLNNDSYSSDLLEGSNKVMRNGYSIHGETSHSHHRESHKRTADISEVTPQSGENSINTTLNSISMPTKELIESSSGKNKSYQKLFGNEEKKLGPKKRHKCPICLKVFKSGQALGGHKRSHVGGSVEDTSMVMKQETSRVTNLIDLNVPAPMEEEESDRWD